MWRTSWRSDAGRMLPEQAAGVNSSGGARTSNIPTTAPNNNEPAAESRSQQGVKI